jgi:hypothetical protein
MNIKPSRETIKLIKQMQHAKYEKTLVEFTILSLLLYFLVIFAPVGVYINIYFVLKANLPVNISPVEYIFLTLAMILVIPVFILCRRKYTEFKNLKVKL